MGEKKQRVLWRGPLAVISYSRTTQDLPTCDVMSPRIFRIVPFYLALPLEGHELKSKLEFV